MARSPLTESIERVNGMVAYVRENLNPDEYDLFLDMVAPEPIPEPAKKPQKKSSKRAAGGGKSKRGESLRQQIQGVAKGGIDRPLEALCVADLPNGAGRCGHEEDDPLHSDTSYGNAHVYQPPAAHAASGGSAG